MCLSPISASFELPSQGMALPSFTRAHEKDLAIIFKSIGHNPDQSSVYIKWLKLSTAPQPNSQDGSYPGKERKETVLLFAGCHTSFRIPQCSQTFTLTVTRTPMSRCAAMPCKSKIMGKTASRAGLCSCSLVLHQTTRGHWLWKDRHSQLQTRSAQIFPSGVNVA